MTALAIPDRAATDPLEGAFMITARRPRAVRSTAVAIVTALIGVACSDDEDSSASTSTSRASTSTETTAANGGASAALDANPDDPYCDIERQIDEAFETAASVQAGARAVIEAGLLDDADELAPDAIRADLDLLISAVQEVGGGNVDALSTSQSDAAGARVDAYCGLGG